MSQVKLPQYRAIHAISEEGAPVIVEAAEITGSTLEIAPGSSNFTAGRITLEFTEGSGVINFVPNEQYLNILSQNRSSPNFCDGDYFVRYGDGQEGYVRRNDFYAEYIRLPDVTPTTSTAGRFRKKPVIIDAYRLPAAGEDVPDSFHDWAAEVGFVHYHSDRDEGLVIPTLEGDMRADPGDWIIKGVKGEFYPCKPDIFAATYEPADWVEDEQIAVLKIKYTKFPERRVAFVVDHPTHGDRRFAPLIWQAFSELGAADPAGAEMQFTASNGVTITVHSIPPDFSDISSTPPEPVDSEIDLEAADFSDALLWLKEGKRVTRKGWNGKGQFVLKAGGYTVNEARPGSDYAKAGIVGEFTIQPHLDLKNAQGRMQPGWVPSQGDLFATDWQVYVEQPASGLPPHQQRVFDERADLDERLTKLKAFMVGETFGALPLDEQARLQEQAGIMDAYLNVLARRITRFAEVR